MGKILGEIVGTLCVAAVVIGALLCAAIERPLLALWARLARWKRHDEDLLARARRAYEREKAARDAALDEIFGQDSKKE